MKPYQYILAGVFMGYLSLGTLIICTSPDKYKSNPIYPVELQSNQQLIEDFNSFDSTSIIHDIYGYHEGDSIKGKTIVTIVVEQNDSLFLYQSKDTYAQWLFQNKQEGDKFK